MPLPLHISIGDYQYPLPEDRIAKFPLTERDQSKLLNYHKGLLDERSFTDLPGLLPENSLLVFNETKVIRARLLFTKTTGAVIEIFCLEPVAPSGDFQVAFQQSSPVIWKCLVGNAKRWKTGRLEMPFRQKNGPAILYAELVEKADDAFLVRFSWEPQDIHFADIIDLAGLVPLPPYLNREAEASDRERYQTVYARHDGSVAAPTAGLHFTARQFDELKARNIHRTSVTLHVGAGTFRPVVSNAVSEHRMHAERIVIPASTLKTLLDHLGAPVIPVGTTSMRTLESLYWLSVKLKTGMDASFLDQWEPYQLKVPPGFGIRDALHLLIGHLEKTGLAELRAETRLMIVPGYAFTLCKGLVTNFHQPGSTLLLLVAALVGEDWKKAYEFAMKHDFRFLSYGDSCLFLP